MRQWSDLRQFSEILEEKLSLNSSAPSENDHFQPTSSESLSEKLALLGLKKVLFQAQKYPENTKETSRWKPTGLNEKLTEAFEFFHNNGEVYLTDKSNLTSLKRAFRRLAKKLHPDRVAHQSEFVQKSYSDNFLKLHKHFKELESFLSSKNKAAA